jgi:hypothetical protein
MPNNINSLEFIRDQAERGSKTMYYEPATGIETKGSYHVFF